MIDIVVMGRTRTECLTGAVEPPPRVPKHNSGSELKNPAPKPLPRGHTRWWEDGDSSATQRIFWLLQSPRN